MEPISPIAIIAGMALWTPFTQDGLPPCHDGLTIKTYAASVHPGASGWASEDDPPCTINLREDMGEYAIVFQCAVIAHEIGHKVFGQWEHSQDPSNVMYYKGDDWQFPKQCQIDPALDRAKPYGLSVKVIKVRKRAKKHRK